MLREKEELCASKNKASVDACERQQAIICSLDQTLQMQKNKAVEENNKSANLALRPERAEKNQKLTTKLAQASNSLKDSEEMAAKMHVEMFKFVTEVSKSIMDFVNSQVQGVDWAQNLHCQVLFALDEEEEEEGEDDDGADSAAPEEAAEKMAAQENPRPI